MIRRCSTPGLTAALATSVVLLVACGSDSDTGPSAADDTTTTTTSAPTREPPTETAPDPDGWTPLPVHGDDGILPPGRYGMTANGYPDRPYAVVEVLGAFSNFDGWTLFKEGFDEDAGTFTGLGYWTISGVYSDPCGVELVEVGNSVEEVAGALQEQERSLVTAPVPVSIDGYQGLYLELQMPTDEDLAECGQYDVWSSDPSGARHLEVPGQLDRNWILEVGGDVVVLQVTASPDVPAAAREQLTGMIESVDFVARD